MFIGGLKERMHRNRQNGQLHALQREAGRLQRRSIEITVAARHPSAIHLSVIEQKTVSGTVLSSRFELLRMCFPLLSHVSLPVFEWVVLPQSWRHDLSKKRG